MILYPKTWKPDKYVSAFIVAFLQPHVFSALLSQNLLYCDQYLPESENSADIDDIFLEFQCCDQFTDYAIYMQAIKPCPYQLYIQVTVSLAMIESV